MVKGPYEFRAEDAERFAREQGIKSFMPLFGAGVEECLAEAN